MIAASSSSFGIPIVQGGIRSYVWNGGGLGVELAVLVAKNVDDAIDLVRTAVSHCFCAVSRVLWEFVLYGVGEGCEQ